MSVIIEMPKLSDTMSVGTVVKWHKNVGDTVANGDTLAEIETDKATMELENFEDGVLLKILVEEGEEAPIGSPLAFVGEDGEEVDAPKPQKELSSTVSENEPSSVSDSVSESTGDESKSAATTTGAVISGNEFQESPKEPIKEVPASTDNRIRISPLAKKIATEKNLDLSKIKGTGPSGRIVKKDILSAEIANDKVESSPTEKIQAKISDKVTSGGHSLKNGLLESKVVPLSGMRSVIAKRLTESKTTIPHFYLQREINIKPLLEARVALNENAERHSKLTATDFNKISVNDLILKACAESIKWHPEINTSWGDSEIIFHDTVDLAFGVAVDGGLLTPVIHNASTLSLVDISVEAKNLISLAREKKLSPESMSGSTFTVTNLGMYNIDFFSGIINPPNAAILSVGSSIKKPVVDDSGKIIVGETLTLGLSCDHRLVDGAVGASFLNSLANNLENPACMLV